MQWLVADNALSTPALHRGKINGFSRLWARYYYTNSVHSYVEAVPCASYLSFNSDNRKNKLIIIIKDHDAVSI